MVRDLFALIFPRTCLNCSAALISKEPFLCTSCKINLPFTDDFSFSENQLFLKFAFQPKIKSAQAFIYFLKGGMTQKLLHHLKYRGRKEIGFELGKWFAPQLETLEIDCIVPVPLYPKKQKRRGFNQSEMVAHGISEVLNKEVRNDLIARVTSTTTQTRKTKIARWTDMENVYTEASEQVEGKNILVVDDMISTGATVGMLCERLVEGKAKSIHIASIARGK